jgi:hypothetical protein
MNAGNNLTNNAYNQGAGLGSQMTGQSLGSGMAQGNALNSNALGQGMGNAKSINAASQKAGASGADSQMANANANANANSQPLTAKSNRNLGCLNRHAVAFPVAKRLSPRRRRFNRASGTLTAAPQLKP